MSLKNNNFNFVSTHTGMCGSEGIFVDTLCVSKAQSDVFCNSRTVTNRTRRETCSTSHGNRRHAYKLRNRLYLKQNFSGIFMTLFL